MTDSWSDYYRFRSSSVITNASFKVRKRIYDRFVARFGSAQRIADVGVTSESVSKEANLLEALFPEKGRITAIGIEDARHLEHDYPGVRFQRVQPGERLPFGDGEFDVVYSHAVIEHVVDPRERAFFMAELMRIGRSIFVTTPNKYFPIELHTFVPLLHFLFPRVFYGLLDRKIINQFYNRTNLMLLSEGDLWRLAGNKSGWKFEVEKIRLFGMVSNLVLIGQRTCE
jgi:SAM-dependent methyltransferase